MDKAESVERQLDRLTTQIMYASENGLFAQTGMQYKNKIDTAIIGADAALLDKKTAEASALVYEAKRYFDEAWNAAPKKWQAFLGHGWMHHLCTILGTIMAGIILFLMWQVDICCIDKCSALFGLLGAVVRCFYWITRQANARTLRRVWATQNVIGPLLGLILGCVANFILRSSLVVVAQDGTNPNPYAIAVLAFYAGFNWEWILSLLSKVASQVNAKNTDGKGSSTQKN